MPPPPKERKLVDLYVELWSKRYGSVPTVNKFRERWAMKDVMESVGFDRAVEIITYYLRVDRDDRHPLQFFYYNFDNIDRVMKEVEADKLRTKDLMRRTKERVEAARERRSSGNLGGM